jgi:hypothetical protein
MLMQCLTEKDYKLFQSLAVLTQESLRKTMAEYVKKHFGEDKVLIKKEYIYAVGDIPIALVAHMDTVFKNPPQSQHIFYDKEKCTMWSPDGLGADDRAGIFAIIKILQAGLKPTVIFTTDEELGAIGAENLVLDIPKPYTELRYIIQLDRRGSNDCVFYNCNNSAFTDYIETFGFAQSLGSFSDISVICPMWGVAGVNLSIGYDDEHTVSETLNTTHMLQTISKVKKMLQVEHIPSFEYIPALLPFGRLSGSTFGYPGWDDWYWEEEYKCEKCGKRQSEYEVLPVISKQAPYKTVYYCGDCCSAGIDWCTECNEGFEVGTDSPPHICPRCAAKHKEKVGEYSDK